MVSAASRKHHELMTIRDTVESVWVAIVLAFVLRTFILEAFVIPTGSMAPRLMGEHYDLRCLVCGYRYSYGSHKRGSPQRGELSLPAVGAYCPSCGAEHRLRRKSYVNSGDRVLVLKYLYRFIEPKPWDVIVFRNPQSNSNNYIKRLIGLPGETIEIVHGDVFVIPYGRSKWRVLRKPDRAQKAMWQTICDNDYRPNLEMLADQGIEKPRRWVPQTGQSAWNTTAAKGRTFAFSGGQIQYLRFKGLRKAVNPYEYPRSEAFDRTSAEAERESVREAFVPRYGYDKYGHDNHSLESLHIEPEVDLCGDLRLSAVLRPLDDDASVSLILEAMHYCVKARFDSDGTVTLFGRRREGAAAGWKKWRQVRIAPLKKGRGYRIALDHVDYSAKVWVEGRKVIDETYQADHDALKVRLDEVADRPLPIPGARIAARGGRLELWHTKLMRDVYYTNFQLGRPPSPLDTPRPDFLLKHARSPDVSPSVGKLGWGVMNNPIRLAKHRKNELHDLDEFFVLGDNSPQSLDSRGWIEAAPSLRLRDGDGRLLYHLGTVPRYNLIGKAIFVYWPAGFRLSLLPGLPIVPNVGRMRLIR